ncbi:MAG: carboxypeptidase regulatory-like domain-containing protein, partial [Blastocatellia bacterium]
MRLRLMVRSAGSFNRFIAILISGFFLVSGVLVERASAQISEGAIVGTVSDVNGGRVTGATVTATGSGGVKRTASTGSTGEFRIESLQPGEYSLKIDANGFGAYQRTVSVAVSASPTVSIVLAAGQVSESVQVRAPAGSLASQPLETTSGVEKTVINHEDLVELPLAHRSFANIAYLAPMTEPVEPSDPTKARITAVSFAGSSGLNVDLSVDGGDNNDDYIGGFLQNYSPDAISEFTVRTAQYDADTSRTNGGSVIITTRRGTDEWHG